MGEVVFKNVGKIYGGENWVVKDFSVTIRDGEFCVLLGPSGCGKSTLLRMLAGLEEISEGEILIDGSVINMVAPKDRDVAMVFQNYALYPHKTVFQNLEYPLKIQKIPVVERRQKVVDAARTLSIDHLLKRYPGQLSGGQKQRVAVGRALVRRPRVYLFDEPLSNLDARLRADMRAELKLLHQKFGITFIFVTHDQVEAMTLADKIVLINEGAIVQMGSPEQIYRCPRSIFAGSFIGSPPMNFIKLLPDSAFRMGLDEKTFSSPAVVENLAAGIRPEAFRFEGDSYQPHLKGACVLLESVGPYYQYHFKLSGEEVLSDHLMVISSEKITGPLEQTVKLYFSPESVIFFDLKSGRSTGESYLQ